MPDASRISLAAMTFLPHINPVFSNLSTTVFETMSKLARETGAINLGQGFPDGGAPDDVIAKAAEAVVRGWNQYPPMPGLPELRQAVAAHYQAHQGIALDWEREVMITSGATEAIAGALFALITPGDEVVLFQPMYDAYLPLVLRAGGVPRFVPLQPPHWRFDRAMLDTVFTPKTRVVLLNNPLNPAAVVLPRDDLELLAEFCVKHDAVVISDEVWEHVMFDGRQHVSMLAIPSMRDRTVNVGSAGKIFSLTGWKVGFSCAAPALFGALTKAHQFLTFTTPPNLQSAVAYGLGKERDYFDGMRANLERSRDRFSNGLRELGFTVLPSEGSYFVNIDLRDLTDEDDVSFAMRLVKEFGVAAIPVSAFYAENKVTNILRFCFAKRDDVLDGALERMKRVKI
jgi:aspartate/methionine/tyrosine aminotransferase